MQELSAFIAAIRPAFKSLLRTFIERKPYSTGEPKIDELLEDTAHFMLYQESIMKVLSFLGLPMGETYGVIKAISKKKLKGEKKEKLEEQLKENWNKIFGNLDNFQKVWDIINDAGRYAFNAPHSLSMCGDSLYQAWFKAHYPSKFYEIAISHYQRKENKDKISALITEAATYFDYTKLPFRFRQDNRAVSVNDKTKEITMCLYSIKGISKSASDILFEYKDAKFNSFIDVIKTIPLDKTTYEALIKLDYFTEFGKSAKLLATYNLYRNWNGRKSIKKTSTEPFSIELLNQFCSKETASQYCFDDIEPLLQEYIKAIPDEDISQKEKIAAQLDHLSYVQATGREEDRRIGYVRAVYPCKRKADNKTWAYKVSVTFLGKGKDSDLTIYKARYNKCKLQKGDIFYADSVSPKDYQGRRYWYLMNYHKI
jgi:DNA polymerase III alpha subunit